MEKEIMQDLKNSDLENICRELLNAFQGILLWKWDSYIDAVLAEFDVGDKDSIRAILERYLGSTWDNSNIDKAPDMVQMIDNNLVGLRPGQLLFTSDPNQDTIVFGAWWPWGDGKTISIRIAPFYKKLSDPEKAEQIKLFKSWFGI